MLAIALVLVGAPSFTDTPDREIGTSTAAVYREAAVLWRQRAHDERSAHKTTRAELDVCREETADAEGRAEAARAAGVSRSSRIALALAGLAAGAGGAVGAAGLIEGRDAVAGVGLVMAAAGAVGGLVALLVDP